MKGFRLFTLMLALATFTVFLSCSGLAFGSASGTIKFNIETNENGKITSVLGSATLFSDDTFWWDIIQWTGHYAQVDGYIDGLLAGGAADFIFTRGLNFTDDVRDHTERTIYWWPSHLEPGEHTVSYRMRDIYSGKSLLSGGHRRRIGNLITEYQVHVYVDDAGQQFLRYSEPLNLGNGHLQCGGMAGEPIYIGTGNSFQQETDIEIPGPGNGLSLIRTYNSRSDIMGPFGFGWTHNYDVRLFEIDSQHIELKKMDGATSVFIKNPDDIYEEMSGKPTHLEPIIVDSAVEGWRWKRRDGRVYTFDATGKLSGISQMGNTISFTYNGINQLERIDDLSTGRSLILLYNTDGLITSISGPITQAIPTGIWAHYLYDENRNLKGVIYADGSGEDYNYTDSSDIHNLTEKRDRLNHLLATWSYDDKDRVVDNWARDGRGISIEYTGYNTRTVTDAYGSTYNYSFTVLNGHKVFTEKSGGTPCQACGNSVVSKLYDSELRIAEVQYANGLRYQFEDYDSKGNARILRIQPGTLQEKTIARTFHPEIQAKLSQNEPSVLGAGDKITIWDHDDDGNALPNENPTQLPHRKIEKGFTRDLSGNVIPYEFITAYTYNDNGQLLTIDGPQPGNQDLTTFAYDAVTADLLSITRPLIGTITYSQYSDDGRVGRMTDSNGNATLFTYDGRGRVLTVTREGSGATSYTYNGAGDLAGIAQANGVTVTFTYDTLYGRLTRMEDTLGNSTRLSYDAQGNRVEISRYDAANQLVFRKRFDYHATENPGKLWKEINPDETFVEYAYDSSGNISTMTDASGKTTSYNYDPLNRMIMVTQPGDVVTSYAYDSQNNLTNVADAANHATVYAYDDLGRLGVVTSPDTGITLYTYDAAGNLVSKKDANGNTIFYTYDALNRITAIHFPDSAQDITYTYDQGSNGKGRLTGMVDPSGTYVYRYNALGLLESEERTLDGHLFTTAYSYDASGLLTGITYPSGRVVSYERDLAGNLEKVTATKEGQTQTLAENITHLPFGPLAGMTYGNGTGLTRTFDQLYRLTDLQAGRIEDLSFSRDPVGNILSIADNLDPARNRTFGYDDLYRLTSAANVLGSFSYTYDKVGNRLTRTAEGGTDTYSYAPGTNRLLGVTGANPLTFSHDANGATTSMGDRTLVYNQNNRLIRVTENANTLGEYVYNGRGERAKKTSDQGTVYFLYDKNGSLMAEVDDSGNITREYIYADGNRLAMIQSETPQDIHITVATSKGRYLSGTKVYAFNGSGNYTGQYAVTDNDGVAIFPLEIFSDGPYSFRADYLSYHFWSQEITVPATLSAQVMIEEENAEVEFTVAGTAQEGVKVYLFDKSGKYLGLYGTTDENGKVSFLLPAGQGFKFRGDYLSNRYWSEATVIQPGGTTQLNIDAGGGLLTVTVQKEPGVALTGLKLYLFSQTDAYLGRSVTTDADGQAAFMVSGGSYKVRADYLGYKFWTDIIPVNSDTVYTLNIPHRDVTATVIGDFNSDLLPFQELNVYLFTPAGAYLGVSQKTDQEGKTTFNLPEREYQLRADYLTRHYWSEGFTWEDKTIAIPEGMAGVTVTGMGFPQEGARVYVFNAEGVYLGLHGETGSDGTIGFRLPEGEYNFRGDYLGNQYWSGNTTLIPHVSNPVNLSTGGGLFSLTVLGNDSAPLESLSCYLFSASGTYIGQKEVTNSQGQADFNLADGDYAVRIDYLGYQFWTDLFSIPGSTMMTKTIPHRDVTITVNGDYAGDVLPLPDLKIYLFTPSGAYLKRSGTTDTGGNVTFTLPDEDFKVRADYLKSQYWSEVFNGTDTAINIPEGVAEIQVTREQNPLADVNVYVFSETNAYLRVNEKTDADGIVSFRLPAGTYNFRADFQGNQYWATAEVQADLVNAIEVNTGGGSVTLTVEKAQGSPLANIPVYAFTEGGAYLGLTARTDEQGLVSFDLADGRYKFRADYLGYQFWSEAFEVPQSLSRILTIPHQDVAITVNKVYGAASEPVQSTKVYLFTESGAYQNIHGDTDAQGQIIFSLPEKAYKFRADYLGSQYWSEVFEWQDTEINIDHGDMRLHVTYDGSDLQDVPVYLFTEQGAYLGKSQRTDGFGDALFTIPAKSYKFRVDYNGTQYWSDIINVIPNEETDVELALEQLALNETSNPYPSRFDGTPPVFHPENIQVASIGSLAGILLQSVVAQTTEEKVYYFINDHLGTPLKLVDENGQIVWSADYQPFGQAGLSTQTITNNFRFPGQYYDEETDLHYNYRRYYDPQTGRYLTPDPIGLEGGIDLYLYALNNAENLTDINGLYVFYWGFGGSLGIGRKMEGNNVNYSSISGIMYQGSTRLGGTEKGIAGILGGGRIIGAVAGAGLVAGYQRGDVEDLSHRSTASGISIGFITIELTFDKNNSWTGFNFGIFKSVGFGIYGVETATDRLPINSYDYEACK